MAWTRNGDVVEWLDMVLNAYAMAVNWIEEKSAYGVVLDDFLAKMDAHLNKIS